jgi:hypothetical protein
MVCVFNPLQKLSIAMMTMIMAQPMKICKGKKKEIQSFHNLSIIEAYMK